MNTGTSKDIHLEACVESLEECILAEAKGADSLELCADLNEGGLSPSLDLVKQVLTKVNIPIKVMLRPRRGDFTYYPDEFTLMRKQLSQFYELGIRELVTGILSRTMEVDYLRMKIICASYPDVDFTFHKAIDEVDDPFVAIESLKDIPNVKSILSSGAQATALEGIENLKLMKEACANKIELIAAGKITDQNIEEIHKLLNLQRYHGRLIVGELI